jgi:hypothetical protein
MNIVARASALASSARGAAALRRAVVPAVLAAAAIAAVSGCSSLSPAASSGHTAPPAASPSQPAPAASTPAPTATTAASPAPSAPQAPQTPPPATPLPTGLTTKITILDTMTGLVPGGPAVRFTVTVTNSSNHPYGNILPLVSLGHCTCTANTLFPAGTLQERESTSNVWQTIPYDVEGFGTDYLNVTEPGGIQELPPGGVATFEYRIFLSPATSAQVIRGTGNLDVTLLPLPSHTPIGSSPAASAPEDVQSGAPPA